MTSTIRRRARTMTHAIYKHTALRILAYIRVRVLSGIGCLYSPASNLNGAYILISTNNGILFLDTDLSFAF